MMVTYKEKSRLPNSQTLGQITISSDFNYDLPGLRKESVENLTRVKPSTLGQASRISGINPSDISICIFISIKIATNRLKHDSQSISGMPEYLNRKNERIKRVGEYLTKYITSKGLHENRKVILEIGCGHGHWLSSFAAKNKENLFIGIDLITKRIEKCNKKKHSLDLTNLFFIKAEALEFLSALSGELQVDSIFLCSLILGQKKAF